MKQDRLKQYRRGHTAELIALLYFLVKAYLPIARRYKTPVGEIDLILKRGRTLIFVEVKGRRTHRDGAFAVHTTNQQRVVRAAQYFLQQRPNYANCEMRFDVCLIAWYRLPKHLPNAFQ